MSRVKEKEPAHQVRSCTQHHMPVWTLEVAEIMPARVQRYGPSARDLAILRGHKFYKFTDETIRPLQPYTTKILHHSQQIS